MTTSADLVRIARGRRMAFDGQGRRIREAAKVSLHDLADAIGVSPTTVARWERRECRPRAAESLRYEQILTELEGLVGECKP